MRLTPSEARMLEARRRDRTVVAAGEWLPGRRGFRVWVPGQLVNLMNQRGAARSGWRATRWAKEAEEGVANALLVLGYRRGDLDPVAPKRVVFCCHVARRFDGVNLLGTALKPYIDGLVACGVLSGDYDRAGHEFPVPEQMIDGARPGVWIEVGPRP